MSEQSPAVLAEVWAERNSQDSRWGEQNHRDGTGEPWYQQKAEFAREDCEQAFANRHGTWLHILREEFYEAMAESDPVKLRAELVQVAAVAVNWIEAIDRRPL